MKKSLKNSEQRIVTAKKLFPYCLSRKDEYGFTLVEVMVVMVVFGIMATGMASMMAVLIQNNDFSRTMTEATTLAESKLEMFKNFDYSGIPSGYGSDEPSPGYSRSWNVEENVPQVEMKQITVTVGWYDRVNQWHSVKIYSIIKQ